MLRLERLAVHLVRQHHLRASRLGDREAPPVLLVLVTLDPFIHAPEDEFDDIVLEARLLEHGPQGRAGPLGRPDRLGEPRHTQRARRQASPPVAGALEGDGKRPCRARPDVGERELERSPDPPAHPEPPARGIDVGDVPVDHEVVEPGRRQVVPKRLEGHAPVPKRELKLLERKRPICRAERMRRACLRLGASGHGPNPAAPRPACRVSAASACGICRNDSGSSGRHARHAATNQRETSCSRAPHGSP